MFYPMTVAFGRVRSNVPEPSFATYPVTMLVNDSYVVNTTRGPYVHDSEGTLMADTVTANFRKRVANGDIVLNNMVRESVKSSWRGLRYYLRKYVGGAKWETTSRLEVEPWPLPVHTDGLALWQYMKDAGGYEGLRDAAVVKSWSKVDESAMAALATLGELPETVNWIVSILKRLVSTMRILRGKASKKEWAEARDYLNSPSVVFDTWLEWRYAIRPLISEMENALEALATIIEKGSRQTARSYVYDVGQSVSVTPPVLTNLVQFSFVKTEKHSVEFRGGVLYDLSEAINELRTVWGLDQPIEAAWELVPFSFIIDWFFNVGTVIGSWSTGIGLSPLGSWVTTIITKRTVCHGYGFTPWWDNDVIDKMEILQYPSVNLEQSLKQRWIDPSRFLLPSFKLKLDPQKILDLVAIGRQLLNAKR